MIARHVKHLDDASFASARGTPRGASRLLHLWPALLPLPSVLLAGWVIVGWKFNGLYGQDPFAYYDYAVGPLRGSILHGAPLSAMFWPLGYPVLVTLASFVLGTTTAAAQVVNVVVGACCVYLTYLLGREVLERAGASRSLASRSGALGALILAVTGRLLESSVLIMADAVALATALLSAWALLRWIAEPAGARREAGWLSLSAAALAWSIVTRWGQAILLLPWLLTALSAGCLRRLARRAWVIVPAAAIVGAQLWLVFSVPPGANLGPHPFAGDLGLIQNDGSGWSLVHLFASRFTTPDGSLRYPRPNLMFYLTGPFRLEYLTPFFFPFVVLGGVVGAVRYSRALVLLLSWPAAVLLFDAGLAEQNPRFVLAALPPIAILAGLGLGVTWDALRPAVRPYAAVTLALGIAGAIAIDVRDLQALNNARNADLDVARWASAAMPKNATALSFGITLTLQHETRLRVIDLSVLSARDLRGVVARRHPLYLLVQPRAMSGQFAARPPGLNFRSLQTAPGLFPLGRLHGYVLERVGSL